MAEADEQRTRQLMAMIFLERPQAPDMERLKERFGERCFELHLSYLELVTDVVRRAQSAGGLRAGDPEDLAHMLVSMINSTIFQWLHRGARTRLVERTELVVDHFLHGAASREPA